ncbi:MAG TPA: glycosyltransferase [Longimicrobiaceae bacterium]
MPHRIVINTWGSFGDVYPYIDLGLALRARGHDAVLAMPAYYRATVEREGLGFHAVGPDLDPTDRETVRRIMDPRTGTEFIIKQLILRGLRQSYEDLRAATAAADLLVTHPITFAGPILAQREGLPWVSTVLAPMSFFSRHDLPVFPPMPWAKKLERVPGMARALVALARRVTRDWVEPVYDFRRQLGLERGGNPIYEGQHSPTLALGLFSSVLAEPQPDWPPRVRVTGAIPYNGPDAGGALAPELEAFLAAGPPPVVFTLGTSAVGAAGDFYAQSVDALRRVGARGVLLVGSHPENLPPELPEGVMAIPFAPHAALFPRASAIVHQGGAGTLHQGLLSGRPTLVVPFAHDQPDNAWRVERLGVSRSLQLRRYTGRRVAEELRALLEEPRYRQRAEAVALTVRAEGGAEAAAEEIVRNFEC